jgi:hypothetical protein
MPIIPEVVNKVKDLLHIKHEAFDHDKVLVIFVLGGPGAGKPWARPPPPLTLNI